MILRISFLCSAALGLCLYLLILFILESLSVLGANHQGFRAAPVCPMATWSTGNGHTLAQIKYGVKPSVLGCSSEATRNVLGKTQRNTPVPGMSRLRQAVFENCPGGRGFLFPDFQDVITEVSCVLKKMCKGCPDSAIVSIKKLSFLHIVSYWYFIEGLLGEISHF